MKRMFPLLALLAGLWLPTTPALAQQGLNCNAYIDDIYFVNIGPGGGDISSTLRWECNRGTIIPGDQTLNIRMCLFITTGTATEEINPRWMRREEPPNTLISYDIFADSNRTQVVNPAESNGSPLSFTLQLPATISYVSGSVPIYARLYPQVGEVLPYQYSDRFLQIQPVYFSYNLSATAPSVSECLLSGVGSVSVPDEFNVHAQIEAACTVGIATDLDFGEVSSLTDGHEQTSTINLHCPSSTMAWHLKLNDGEHGTGGQRRMANADGTLFVEYELYRDSSRTQRWGDTDDTDVDGTGTGSVQTVTVYGRTSLQSPTPPPGVYSDTITVTLTF